MYFCKYMTGFECTFTQAYIHSPRWWQHAQGRPGFKGLRTDGDFCHQGDTYRTQKLPQKFQTGQNILI
jgi:hypothetical protein